MKIKNKRIFLLEDLLRKNNIEIPEREKKEEEIEKVVSKNKNEENKIKNLNVKKPKLYMKYIDDNLGIDDENNEKKMKMLLILC